jgi:hypothetical protein
MNNRIGLGVFGTFGEPYGYQQSFYYDVHYNGTLDLNEAEIEFYPGSKLFAVRRELIDGVYTVCFCIYSYARELNTERFGTFLGTCIVLQDGYAEADYIYASLKSLHEHVMNNDNNVENNIIIAQKAQDVVLKEPDEFVALKANVIPISKTPFFSSSVDTNKRFLVTPNPLSEDSKETQVINFFDKALKHYNDSESLYFSFDRNVYEFVTKADELEITDWDEFIEYQPAGPASTVVRTKKGIQKTAQEPTSTENETEIKASPRPPEKANVYQSKPPAFDDDYDDDDDDPNRPFNLWEGSVPPNGWPAKEVEKRTKEYNRLFKYTNTLLAHINGPQSRKENIRNGNIEYAPDDTRERRTKRTLLVVILLLAVLFGSLLIYRLTSTGKKKAVVVTETPEDLSPASVQEVAMPDTSETAEEETTIATDADTLTKKQAAPASVVAVAARETEKVIPVQAIARVPVPENTPTSAEPAKQAPIPAAEAARPSSGEKPKASPISFTGKVPPVEEAPRNPLTPVAPPLYQKAKELHPRPNIEMSQNDIMMLREIGVKNKTLAELTRLLFDNVPSNIGIIYRGQETEYGAALLNSNRQAFQKSGDEYICTSNTLILHIPAYKSPHLPSVFPK